MLFSASAGITLKTYGCQKTVNTEPSATILKGLKREASCISSFGTRNQATASKKKVITARFGLPCS